MSKRCPVCKGRKYIRLPLRPELSTVTMPDNGLIAHVQNDYRDYPCPECSPTVGVDRVRVVECGSIVVTEYEKIPEYEEHVHRDLALSIGKEIAQAGYMRFEKGDPDPDNLSRTYRATVGVVGSAVVNYLEKEYRRREDAFADKVAERIKKEINNWGSYYANHTINKTIAIDLINDALRHVKEHRHEQ